jgi:hypothetical protein
MVDGEEDLGRSRRPGAENQGWSSTGQVLGGRTIESSGDVVCDLHRTQGARVSWFSLKTKVDSFSQFGLKIGGYDFSDLALKPVATVSPSLISKPVAMVLVVWPKNHSLRSPGLVLKTGSCSLLIWPTKSLRWFLGLGLQTKWAMVCRLSHNTNGRMKIVRDTCHDLATCFAWKQVRLGFPSLPQNWCRSDSGLCT